ncbi:MAG: hypothetical protein AB1529_07715 [Candidatus Micrarchaeota archaeon]
MVKKHNWLLIGGVTACLGAGAFVAHGTYKDIQRQEAHRRSVSTLVESLKACPDRFRAVGDCSSDGDRAHLLSEAETDRREGRFREAGLKFARLGREGDAREMAGRCDESGRRAILEELSVRRDAAAEVTRGLPR